MAGCLKVLSFIFPSTLDAFPSNSFALPLPPVVLPSSSSVLELATLSIHLSSLALDFPTLSIHLAALCFEFRTLTIDFFSKTDGIFRVTGEITVAIFELFLLVLEVAVLVAEVLQCLFVGVLGFRSIIAQLVLEERLTDAHIILKSYNLSFQFVDFVLSGSSILRG